MLVRGWCRFESLPEAYEVIHFEKSVLSSCRVEAAVLARRNTARNARNAHNPSHDRLGRMIINLRGRTPQAIFCPPLPKAPSAGATKADARLGRALGFRWGCRTSGLRPAIAPPSAQVCTEEQGYGSLSVARGRCTWHTEGEPYRPQSSPRNHVVWEESKVRREHKNCEDHRVCASASSPPVMLRTAAYLGSSTATNETH